MYDPLSICWNIVISNEIIDKSVIDVRLTDNLFASQAENRCSLPHPKALLMSHTLAFAHLVCPYGLFVMVKAGDTLNVPSWWDRHDVCVKESYFNIPTCFNVARKPGNACLHKSVLKCKYVLHSYFNLLIYFLRCLSTCKKCYIMYMSAVKSMCLSCRKSYSCYQSEYKEDGSSTA